jgi:hypothetical protein
MKTKVNSFWIDQVTKSFPEGAPQREEYDSFGAFFDACKRYGEEWRATYDCGGACRDLAHWECPQCWPMIDD